MKTTSTTIQIGHLRPDDYAALEATVSRSARVELGELPTLVISGPDRSSWLNGLLTCDVTGVNPGHGTWGLLLDRLGKVQAVLGVVADAERLYLGVFWGDAQAVAKELDARLVMEDAELAPSETPAFWRLRMGNSLPLNEPDAAASGAITLASKSLLSVAFGAALPADSAPALSPEAWTLVRVQWGLPWGGVDFDDAERPHEAALERRAISWSKGCYLGQEVVCMQDMRGKVKRSVRPFVIASAVGPEIGAVNADILQEARPVGRVTSAVYDPRAARYWVLAHVPLAALPDSTQAASRELETDLTWSGVVDAKSRLHLVEPQRAWTHMS